MNQSSENTRHLDSPTAAQIKAAYTALPTQGQVLIDCCSTGMADALANLEAAGFFAMHIKMPAAKGGTVSISAFKGKEGPCYDTGKSASYKGSATAALDDDNHLLCGDVRVCEKTARIYASDAYADVVTVSTGDQALLDKLQDAPVVFDCDTFETIVERLMAKIDRPQSEPAHLVGILYPGPFKLLVLDDGTILRRGVATRVGRHHAQRLAAMDGCIVVEENIVDAVPTNLIDAYAKMGPVCLLNDGQLQSSVRRSPEVMMAGLQHAPESAVNRLKKMIERGDSYFLLTGSDPRDELGCCPSDDVGACNQLVEAGLLDCWHPPSTAESCTSAVYAFRDEIGFTDQSPSFHINAPLRRQVMDLMATSQPSGPKVAAHAIRWTLLLFVAISIGFAFLDETHDKAATDSVTFAQEISLGPPKVIVVCNFHRTERCDSCDNMRRYTRSTLDRYFADALRSHSISYRDVNIDLPENRNLAEQYQVFTSSVVLILIERGKVRRSKTLADAWQYAGFMASEDKFTQMLRSELAHFAEDVE